MAQLIQAQPQKQDKFNPGKAALWGAVVIVTLLFMWYGFDFMRAPGTYIELGQNENVSKGVLVPLSIVWGVGGFALLFTGLNNFIEAFPLNVSSKIQPFIFVGPALILLFYYLVFPTIRTGIISFQGRFGSGMFTGDTFGRLQVDGGVTEGFFGSGDLVRLDYNRREAAYEPVVLENEETGEVTYPIMAEFIGWDNYTFAFTNDKMVESFVNNFWWLVLVTAFTVGFGLIVAVLADRSQFEVVAKSTIFLPMAISFVGAGVIWKFIYDFSPFGDQIGLLNAMYLQLGGEAPIAWLIQQEALLFTGTIPFIPELRLNTLLLIVILIWLQTGFAMVLLSAALKGVADELLEAARIDGANEIQIFFRIIIPSIMSTIITVSTTITILTLKIFDIVFVVTSGENGTEVIASQMYKQMFKFQHFGRGAAIAMVLLIAVIPVMYYNLRGFQREGTF